MKELSVIRVKSLEITHYSGGAGKAIANSVTTNLTTHLSPVRGSTLNRSNLQKTACMLSPPDDYRDAGVRDALGCSRYDAVTSNPNIKASLWYSKDEYELQFSYLSLLYYY